ncbi:MAG: type II 3-dehydroquinate dehydratase [Acidimicrobiales bacterium]
MTGRRVLLLNGPNLNLLGTREPEIYGSESLDDIVERVVAHGRDRNCEVRHVQSNSEGALVDALHDAMSWADGVVFNAGGYTHTSVALRDAISGCSLPVVETHLSNVHSREEFRHKSLLAPVCVAVVAGFGSDSYRVALSGLLGHLDRRDR